MKPSEKILKIFDKWNPLNPDKSELAKTQDMFSAIMTYLDEEYEKQNAQPK